MEGFKTMVRMKTGGSVSKAVEEAKMCSGGKANKYKEGGKVHDDEAQDKALIKKELSKFAKEEDKGEKTELKLKQGGRSKKAAGTVKKFKAGGAIEMNKTAGDKDTIKKVKATGAKKADAPSKAAAKPAFKGSDVAKEKSKPANDKDATKKVKAAPKKAVAPSKGEAKVSDVENFAEGGMAGYGRGGSIGAESPIPPSIAAQLMQAQNGAALRGPTPSPMGTPAVPGDNPVMGGGAPAPQPFNAYQNFRRANPNAKPGMNPQQIEQLLQSPAFQRSNQNFTDR